VEIVHIARNHGESEGKRVRRNQPVESTSFEWHARIGAGSGIIERENWNDLKQTFKVCHCKGVFQVDTPSYFRIDDGRCHDFFGPALFDALSKSL